jgi:cysteinyl-tRNA synthetase
MDFTLWKSAKPGEPAWESPWGAGRPGWHIECSAMNLHHLGERIDIHGGGNDLIFPHHENEIAQTESLTGQPFAKYWVHNGMLQFSGEKMSKSLGNLVTIQEFLEEHEGDVLRMIVLNSSYRSPLTFNEEVISQAEKALERLRSALRPATPDTLETPAGIQEALQQQIARARDGFVTTMDDDFNTAGALGYIFDLVRVVNQSRDSGADDTSLKSAQDTIQELTGILGLKLDKDGFKSNLADPFIDLIVDIRNRLRDQKNWDLSDQIRDQLESMGVLLEDSKSGTSWRWK